MMMMVHICYIVYKVYGVVYALSLCLSRSLIALSFTMLYIYLSLSLYALFISFTFWNYYDKANKCLLKRNKIDWLLIEHIESSHISHSPSHVTAYRSYIHTYLHIDHNISSDFIDLFGWRFGIDSWRFAWLVLASFWFRFRYHFHFISSHFLPLHTCPLSPLL